MTWLHNETDIFGLHMNMPTSTINKKIGYTVKIKKTIIDSLPTKKYKCGRSHFETCLKNKIAEGLIKQNNCYIPFLSYDNSYSVCPKELTLRVVKTWLHHILTLDDYKGCSYLKPCQDIVYSFAEKNFRKPGQLEIQFQNKFVEVITDTYSFTSLSLFAELGGVIGMLLGLSVIGSFQALMEGLQQHSWMVKNLKENMKRLWSNEQKKIVPENKNKSWIGETHPSHGLEAIAKDIEKFQESIKIMKDAIDHWKSNVNLQNAE